MLSRARLRYPCRAQVAGTASTCCPDARCGRDTHRLARADARLRAPTDYILHGVVLVPQIDERHAELSLHASRGHVRFIPFAPERGAPAALTLCHPRDCGAGGRLRRRSRKDDCLALRGPLCEVVNQPAVVPQEWRDQATWQEPSDGLFEEDAWICRRCEWPVARSQFVRKRYFSDVGLRVALGYATGE